MAKKWGADWKNTSTVRKWFVDVESFRDLLATAKSLNLIENDKILVASLERKVASYGLDTILTVRDLLKLCRMTGREMPPRLQS